MLASRIFCCFFLILPLWLGITPAGWAAGLSPDAVSVLAGPCSNCHGLDGVGAGSIPALRGRSASDLRNRLLAFQEGKSVDATVMTRLMKGYDRTQIDALANWFAAEARQ